MRMLHKIAVDTFPLASHYRYITLLLQQIFIRVSVGKSSMTTDEHESSISSVTAAVFPWFSLCFFDVARLRFIIFCTKKAFRHATTYTEPWSTLQVQQKRMSVSKLSLLGCIMKAALVVCVMSRHTSSPGLTSKPVINKVSCGKLQYWPISLY